jgi:epoxyqueuosine reductase QueG
MNSIEVKQIIYDLSADICGIASIDRFSEAPEGFHPTDTLPSCKSVIVFGKKFLRATLDCSNTIPYTVVRNMLSQMLDIMSIDFCNLMETKNILAVPTGAIDPVRIDEKTNRRRSAVSAKHAAVAAGLGYIGKNTLLITPEYGNMVWLTAVLIDAELEPDNIIDKTCPANCSLCIDSCPVNALKKDNLEMEQLNCRNYAFHINEGEDFYFKCNKCRTICPHRLGTKNREA